METGKQKWKLTAVCLCIFTIGLVIAIIHRMEQREMPDGSAGQEAPVRSREHILFMGLGSSQAEETEFGRRNDRQADLIMVFILDRENGTCDLLHLHPDTMTEIMRAETGAPEAGCVGQLGLAFTFGSGGSDSCIHAKQAVSGLLGAPIDHYVAVSLEAVGILNDLVGGVTLETSGNNGLNSSWGQEKSVTLTGEQALHCLCSRSESEDSTGSGILDRQQQYADALIQQVYSELKERPDFAMQAIAGISPYLQSDYSISQLKDLKEAMQLCVFRPIVTISGESVINHGLTEFYPDRTSLNKITGELFP